jgi:hypothetical protein
MRIRRMMTIRPRVPLGAYPQLRLYPHDGNAPISIRMRITNRMVNIRSSRKSGGQMLGQTEDLRKASENPVLFEPRPPEAKVVSNSEWVPGEHKWNE